jgi:hypothetical protein
MIDIKELGPEHIGKLVEYRAGTGQTERGRIKSWTDKYVRVVYKCDNQWLRFQDFTGCATDPCDLTFLLNQAEKDRLETRDR